MRVRLTVQMSGTRDGVPWPPIGSIVELPDDEARDMLYAGTAGPVDGETDVPRMGVDVPDDVEEATERFIPETAQHEPAVPIETLPEDDRRPLMENVGLTDDGEIGHGPANPPKSLQPVGVDGEPLDMTASAEENRRVEEGRERTSAGRADGSDGSDNTSDPSRTHGDTNGDDGESASPLTTENGPSKTVRRASKPTTRK